MSRSLIGTLRQLLLSLLNATIMLLIVLTISGIVLLGQVQGFTTDATNAVQSVIRPQMVKIERISDGIEKLNTRLEKVQDGKFEGTAELAALRLEASQLRTQIASLQKQLTTASTIPVKTLASRLLAEMAQMIGQSDNSQ